MALETINLEIQTRNPAMKAGVLRANNLIPAEYYGRGVENRSLQIDYQTFRRAFKKAGTNTILTLKIDGKDEVNVLVHSLQFDPVTDAIAHIDFTNVRLGEELHTKIPLEFVGQAPAVKELSGMLMTNLTEIEIKCLPKDLIHNIEVSIESLVDFHSFIRVKDLDVPDTITVLNEPEDVVVTVVAPKEEKEEVEGEAGSEGDAEGGAGQENASADEKVGGTDGE